MDIKLTERDNEELGTQQSHASMMAWLARKKMSPNDLVMESFRRRRKRFALKHKPITDIPLHVIIPVARPHNLQSLAYSVVSAKGPHNFSVRWHCIFKNHENRYNIINIYNDVLDSIKDGWVHFMCDDNQFHSELFYEFSKAIDSHPDMGAFVVSIFGRHGKVMKACPEMMVPFGVDASQTFIRRDIIGDTRYNIHKSFSADSKFACDVYKNHKDKFVFSDKVLAYYERTIRDDDGELYKEEDKILGT